MDNEKLAKAIVALYSVVSQKDDWDDTDEAIQNAAFQLYEKVDLHPVDFAVMLFTNGMHLEHAINFCDVAKRDVQNAVKGRRWW